jgi:hypothetical protein
MGYDAYNREERALCFHLFRLLHEKLTSNPKESGLYKLIEKLATRKKFKDGDTGNILNELRFDNMAIYAEVALIRDRFENLKPEKTAANEFMDGLVTLVKGQEKRPECRLYSDLPEILRDYKKTHPKQIKAKAEKEKTNLNPDEMKVYGAVQAMFNAKPDLAITIDNYLLVFEAKFTEKFDDAQLIRTGKIAQVWASDLLFRELGFKNAPTYTVVKLGLKESDSDITWRDIWGIAEKMNFAATDRSYRAFKNALNYERQELEVGVNDYLSG